MHQNNHIQHGLYRHYKGQLYQVIGTAIHSETEQLMVVYQCLYGDYQLWVRPLSMFTESVTIDSGQIVPRFTFLKQQY